MSLTAFSAKSMCTEHFPIYWSKGEDSITIGFSRLKTLQKMVFVALYLLYLLPVPTTNKVLKEEKGGWGEQKWLIPKHSVLSVLPVFITSFSKWNNCNSLLCLLIVVLFSGERDKKSHLVILFGWILFLIFGYCEIFSFDASEEKYNAINLVIRWCFLWVLWDRREEDEVAYSHFFARRCKAGCCFMQRNMS